MRIALELSRRVDAGGKRVAPSSIPYRISNLYSRLLAKNALSVLTGGRLNLEMLTPVQREADQRSVTFGPIDLLN